MHKAIDGGISPAHTIARERERRPLSGEGGLGARGGGSDNVYARKKASQSGVMGGPPRFGAPPSPI